MSEKPVRKLTSDINCAIHNKFEFEVIDAETKEVKQRAEAYNVICDTFWPKFCSMTSDYGVYSAIAVGNGSGTPSTSDTQLFSKLAAFSSWQVMPDFAYNGNYGRPGTLSIKFPSPGVIEYKRAIIIEASQLVGEDISEIGLAPDGTNIITHAMLQDMNGNSLVIHKTEHDIIYIYAVIYMHYNPQGFNGIYIDTPPNETGRSGLTRQLSLLSNLIGFWGNQASWNQRVIWSPLINGKGQIMSESIGGYNMTGDTQNNRVIISVTRILQNVANRPLPFIGFTSGVPSELDTSRIPDLYITPSSFPNSQLVITNESIGTGDGTTTDFNTKFPVKSNLAIYIDGILQNSGYSILYGCDRIYNDYGTSWLNKMITGLQFECYYKGRRTISPTYVEGAGGWCFVPAQSDSFIYKNPDKQYFNSIDYKFGVDNLSDGVTIYIETSEDQNTWTVIDTQIPSNSGERTYTVNLQTPINPTYIRFRWVVTDPHPSGLHDDGHRIYLNTVYFYNDTYGSCNLHFDTPPASGAVITADYLPDCIPKDENHVLDVGFTIQFGAYTGSGV